MNIKMALGLSCLILLLSFGSTFSQNQLHIEGEAKIETMNVNNVSDNIVVQLPDGTLAITSKSNLTSIVTDSNTNTSFRVIAVHNNGNGTTTDIKETISNLNDNNDGTFTYFAEDGSSTTYDETTTSLSLVMGGTELRYTDEDGIRVDINLCNVVETCETVTALTFNSVTNSLLYTDEDNNLNIVPISDLASTVSDDNANTSIRTIATHSSGDGTNVAIEETVTQMIDNGDGTHTYISENGTQTIIGIPNSPFVSSSNSSKKSKATSLNVTTINLWGTGVNYAMKNTSAEKLNKCNAAIIPSDFGLNGFVEIKLVVMLEGKNANNANFSLSANNGENITHPISNNHWNYKTINENTIASSEWQTWSAGDDVFEINLQGWMNKGQTEISKAYISIRPKQ